MKLFVYVILLLVGCNESKDVLDEHKPPRKLTRAKRILHGEQINTGAAVFMCSVQRRSDRAHLCGASLITLRSMVTTCSCVAHSDDSASGIMTAMPEGHIVIGGVANNFNVDDAHTRNVSRFEADNRCRYDLEAGMWEYNYGYITVVEPFRYMGNLGVIKNLHETQEDLNHDLAVLMNDTEYQEGGKKFCLVYGWGATNVKRENNVFDATDVVADLRHKAVQFIDRINCKVRLCGISEPLCAFDMDKNHCFCVVSASGKIGPLCDTDNGSPLVCDSRIYGVGEILHECGSVKGSLFFTLDIESLRHYLLTGSSVITTPQTYILILLITCTAMLHHT